MSGKIGNITWFEVLGSDAEALRSFYSDVLGWTFAMQDTPMGPYGVVSCEQGGVPGGVGAAPMGAGWTTFYVGVADVDAAVEKAVAAGGRVLLPPTDLPETRIAVVADPEGHPVGLSRAS